MRTGEKPAIPRGRIGSGSGEAAFSCFIGCELSNDAGKRSQEGLLLRGIITIITIITYVDVISCD